MKLLTFSHEQNAWMACGYAFHDEPSGWRIVTVQMARYYFDRGFKLLDV